MRERLINKRTQKGYTAKQVADKLGISTAYYYMIENGERTPHYDKMVEIANLFGVKPDYFFYPSEQLRVDFKEKNYL